MLLTIHHNFSRGINSTELDACKEMSRPHDRRLLRRYSNQLLTRKLGKSCGRRCRFVIPETWNYPTFALLRFQYRYPGTPTSTIAVPQKASVGRVMMVFSVQAVPTRT